MPVIIEINQRIAFVDSYQWFCPDGEIQDMLRKTLDPSGASPSWGDPDIYAARIAKAKFGAKIINIVPEYEGEEETVY